MDGRSLVAWNLRKERVARGLSQEALASAADLDRTYIGGLERGIENPTVAVLDRLAGALGIHVSALLLEPLSGHERTPPLRGGRKPRERSGVP